MAAPEQGPARARSIGRSARERSNRGVEDAEEGLVRDEAPPLPREGGGADNQGGQREEADEDLAEVVLVSQWPRRLRMADARAISPPPPLPS